MYQFHCWVVLSQSQAEIDEVDIDLSVAELKTRAAQLFENTVVYRFFFHNGRQILTLNGCPNRRGSIASSVRRMLECVVEKLPGSYGLLYEHDEGVELPVGRGLFTVTVVKKGQLVVALDPFLSPAVPVIEDPEWSA